MKIRTVEKNKKFLPLIIGGIVTIVFIVMIGISIYLNNASVDMKNGEYIAPIGILLIVLFTAKIFTRLICFTIHSMMINECDESDIKFLNSLKTIKNDPLHTAYKEYLDLKSEIEENIIIKNFVKHKELINCGAMIIFGIVGAQIGYGLSKDELETWEIVVDVLFGICLSALFINVYYFNKYTGLSTYYAGEINSFNSNKSVESSLIDGLKEYNKILSDQLCENVDLLENISKTIEILKTKDDVNSKYISILLQDLDKRRNSDGK